MSDYGLEHHGIVRPGKVHWNLPVAHLVEEAVRRSEGVLTSSGALNALTGKRTGRSPRDKFVVEEATSPDIEPPGNTDISIGVLRPYRRIDPSKARGTWRR